MHVYSDSVSGGGVRRVGGRGEESLNIISDQCNIQEFVLFCFLALSSRNRRMISLAMQVLCGVRADNTSSPICSLELLELHSDSSWLEPNFQPHWF